jgi:hypothetical protein
MKPLHPTTVAASRQSAVALARFGVPRKRSKPLEIEECGFLPKAATLHL